MSTTFHACSFCGDELAVDDSLKSALPMLADALVLAHQSVCEEFLALSGDILVTEVEAHLRAQCDFTRRTMSGVTYRCRNNGCAGRHYMVREGES